MFGFPDYFCSGFLFAFFALIIFLLILYVLISIADFVSDYRYLKQQVSALEDKLKRRKK